MDQTVKALNAYFIDSSKKNLRNAEKISKFKEDGINKLLDKFITK